MGSVSQKTTVFSLAFTDHAVNACTLTGCARDNNPACGARSIIGIVHDCTTIHNYPLEYIKGEESIERCIYHVKKYAESNVLGMWPLANQSTVTHKHLALVFVVNLVSSMYE